MTPGPPPKPAEARRRYNRPAGGEWCELYPLEGPVLGPIPRRKGGWSAQAKRAWEAWRKDPVSVMWGPADRAYALDTLALIDQLARSSTCALAGEVRLRLDGLGLSPKGRQMLRWRIVTEPTPPAPRPYSSRTSARGRRLRAVAND